MVVENPMTSHQHAKLDSTEQLDKFPPDVGLRSPSLELVSNDSLTLHNGFNTLSMEHSSSELIDHSVVIALGVDPIGCDD